MPPTGVQLAPARKLPVIGVDEGPFTLHPVVTGRDFTAQPDVTDRAVLVGAQAADILGLGSFDGHRALWIDGEPYTVWGIIDSIARRKPIMSGLIVQLSPDELAGSEVEVVVETLPGAARQVTEQAPLALRPDDPAGLRAVAPPDPKAFRLRFESRVRDSLLVVSLVAITAGVLIIANTMSMAVAARRSEIGIRKALGATGLDIFVQFGAESTVIGLVGGILGGSLGVVAAVVAARRLGWNPVIDPRVLPTAALIGLSSGLVSGLWPALRAARTDPLDALWAAE